MKKTDTINKDVISKMNPCSDRFNNFKQHYLDFNGDLLDFINLEYITYSDKVWVFTKLFTPMQNVKWSLLCASKVLSIFEKEYPEDIRPRVAIETTKKYINDPSEENRIAACAAANAAVYAVYAAYAATIAATNAVYAAANAAYAAYAAGSEKDTEEEINLLLALECVD